MPERITWNQIVSIEPALGCLERDALAEAKQHTSAYDPTAHFCGYPGYSGVKRRLVGLVGHYRFPPHPVLGTSGAYDVAYGHLLMALPPAQGRRRRQSASR